MLLPGDEVLALVTTDAEEQLRDDAHRRLNHCRCTRR